MHLSHSQTKRYQELTKNSKFSKDKYQPWHCRNVDDCYMLQIQLWQRNSAGHVPYEMRKKLSELNSLSQFAFALFFYFPLMISKFFLMLTFNLIIKLLKYTVSEIRETIYVRTWMCFTSNQQLKLSLITFSLKVLNKPSDSKICKAYLGRRSKSSLSSFISILTIPHCILWYDTSIINI